MAAVEETLEVGCLHVGLIALRNIKPAKRGGMGDFFGLAPQQHKPYCKINLGGHELTSGVGVRTTAGHAWNREQMYFPVKVPLSCVVGVSGDQARWWNKTPAAGNRSKNSSYGGGGGGGGGLNQGPEKAYTGVGGGGLNGCGSTGVREKGAGVRTDVGGGGGDVACGSSLSRAAAAADAAAAYEAWGRLTLRVQVLHREEGPAASKETRHTATSADEISETPKSTASSTTAVKAMEAREPAHSDRGRDRVLGECSLNLVEVVSGRAPHIEEWVPLDSGGDLRLSLDYDSVGTTSAPGDSVVLLCLSNRLDFFPLPVWDTAADPGRPGSPSWLWARDASQRRLLGPGGGRGSGGVGGEGGFRVEEAGDDFFLISYATPEGWRCAVEVHRFLVYSNPNVPRRWTLSGVRDHAIATPAAAAVRGAVLRASREESPWAAGKLLALDAARGVSSTAARWWGGGLDRVRSDVCFAMGLADADSSAKSDEEEEEEEEEEERAREADNHLVGTQVLPLTTPESGAGGLAHGGARANPALAVGTTASSSIGNGGGGGSSDLMSSAPTSTRPAAAAAAVAAAAVAVAAAASPSRMERESKTAAAPVAVPSELSQPRPPPQQQHLCPITRCPIEDPAVAADGYTYERAAIERWLAEHDTSPVTGKVLETKVVFKNWSLVSSTPPSGITQEEDPT